MVLTVAVLIGASAATAEDARPNIILIMADDLGYECLGAYGGTSYKTTRLDEIASTGIRFNHCYSQPICSPSRNQIMTGIYNNRNYRTWGTLERDQRTFGHLLQQAGYVTCMAGKWQLSGGKAREGLAPIDAGFDETLMWAYGFDVPESQQHVYQPIDPDRTHMTSRYWYPCLVRNGFQDGKILQTTFDDYGPDAYCDFVLDFIERHKDQPFFVYYPMALTHGPFVPTPDTSGVGKLTNQQKLKGQAKAQVHFGEMVAYTDKLVGRIVDRLDELGLRDNTLILFTGDNGTPQAIRTHMRNSRTITGGKGLPTDAGTHVPLLVNWRGKIPGSRVCDDLIDFTDFLPTVVAAAKAEVPSDRAIDGHSFLPQILGKKGSPRNWIFCHYDKSPSAKVPNPKFPRTRFARTKRYKLYGDGRFFDVANDVLEQNPLNADAVEWMVLRKLQELQVVLDSMPLGNMSR